MKSLILTKLYLKFSYTFFLNIKIKTTAIEKMCCWFKFYDKTQINQISVQFLPYCTIFSFYIITFLKFFLRFMSQTIFPFHTKTKTYKKNDWYTRESYVLLFIMSIFATHTTKLKKLLRYAADCVSILTLRLLCISSAHHNKTRKC